MGSPLESAIRLTGYQQRWVADRARFKIGRWARQTGKSFVTTLESGFDMVETGAPWVILSSGERASRENGEKLQMHLQAIGAAAEPLEGYDVFGEATYKVHEIRLPNRGRAIFLPANPDTARGHSANVLLDEFAFHRDSRKIWAALFPTITRGYKLRVVSTPQGKKNKFYELATNPEYSQHVVTIYDAVESGLVLHDEDGRVCTPEGLRLALADDEAWSQEYEVAFLDEATAWLSYELIGEAEDADLDVAPAWVAVLIERAQEEHRKAPTDVQVIRDVELPTPSGEIFVGFDVARRRDLSVLWVLEQGALSLRTAAVIDLAKLPFGVQERVLWTVIARLPVRRGCIDRTGLGMQLAERAVEKFGEHRVEGIDFTNANKEVLAVGLKRGLEDHGVRIPAERRIRESLHSLKRYQTATGAFRFDADRTEALGHADHAWALGLARQAATGSGVAAADVGDAEDEAPGRLVGAGGFVRGGVRFWGRR